MLMSTVACSFTSDSSGAGGSHGLGDSADGGDGMVAEDSGGDIGDDADDGAGTGGDNDGDSGGADDLPPPNDDGPGTPARLEINGGAGFDFEIMAPNGSQPVTLAVKNVGGEQATAIVPSVLSTEFVYVGGFPGEGGTCGAALAPNETCVIGVAYRPLAWGFHETALRLSYDGGNGEAADAPLTGACGGLSANLLTNPGFEDGLTGWTPSPSSWTTSTGGAPEGSRYAYAGESSNNTFTLRQTVVVSQWSPVIDDGDLQVILRGSHRAGGWKNDPNYFVITFKDTDGMPLGTHEGNSNDWVDWQPLDVSPMAPVGTRAIEFAAVCTKSSGTQCDGYYDAISVQGRFPPQ